jgi:hypothetical protein
MRGTKSMILFVAVLLAFVAGCSGQTDSSPRASSQFAKMKFRPYQVIDKMQGGLVVGTYAVPEGWNAVGKVVWNYSECSYPYRISARVEAPDGSAWVESFPSEVFFWGEPRSNTPIGGRSLGMIHKPNVGVQEALQRFVIGRYRAKVTNLKILGFRTIPNLPKSLGKPPVPGDSLAARVRYTVDGNPVDEEFFCILGQRDRIPYHGPQGTSYENHRVLGYVFSMGARGGKLDGLHPLLGFIVSSYKPDPVWEQHRQQVQNYLNAEFNKNLARGYAQIAAAGALSRSISGNNDAMLRAMETQRTSTQRASANRTMDRTNDDFDQYIRGTERMQDPYWGTSEQSYTSKYHWTDGSGNYQHSNDAGFNPNNSSNQKWQLMEPAK